MKTTHMKSQLTTEELKHKLWVLHYRENLNLSQISRQLKITRSSLRFIFKKHKLKIKNYHPGKQKQKRGSRFHEIYGFKTENELKDELIKLYNREHLSQPQIAKKFNCYEGQIYKLFRKFKIKTRSFGAGNLIRIKQNVKLTIEQCQIIDGILLGDGSIIKNKYTGSLSYDCRHRAILEDLKSKLPFDYCPISARKTIKKNKDITINYKLRTHSYKQLYDLRMRWYPRDIKIIPKDIKLSPLTCYWWYLGDGFAGRNKLSLFTNGFTFNDVKFIIGLSPVPGKLRRAKSTSGRILPVIDITTPYIEKFLRYIGPCHHKDLEYRWFKRTMHYRVQEGKRYEKRELIS